MIQQASFPRIDKLPRPLANPFPFLLGNLEAMVFELVGDAGNIHIG